MKKNNRIRALSLTRHILEEYWQKNITPIMNHIHDDILWIGSADQEYIRGSEQMIERLNENHDEMPPVFLQEQEYRIVHHDTKTCVIAGRYRAFTKPESGVLLSEKQRVTFIWEMVKTDGGEELKIKHLHLSNVIRIQDEDERFPTRAGRENFEYMQRIMAERSLDRVISLKDTQGVNRVFNYSDIMYIKADRNYVRLILGNGQAAIRVRAKFSNIMDMMPDGFIKVSRSFGVNRSFVKSVHGTELVMIDGEVFQIPAKACVKVREAITGKKSEPQNQSDSWED